MNPGPTQVCFRLAENRGLTQPLPGYFLTQHDDIFFDWKVKKIEKYGIFGKIFQTCFNPSNKKNYLTLVYAIFLVVEGIYDNFVIKNPKPPFLK